ncbi:MAG: zinc-binding dehydrogenase [Acidimicrobiales bacterium]
MHAWVLFESPGTYRWGEVEDPPLRAGEVRVRVVVSALNHMDLWVARGLPKPNLPHVPGADAAGVVAELGTGVTSCAVGDEVVVDPTVCRPEAIAALGIDAPVAKGTEIVGEHRWGAHGGSLVVPARNVVRRPDGRSWAECAAYPTAYVTAWRALRRTRVAAGEVLLIVGFGSGVSVAALAIARHLGAEVHITSRDATKRSVALTLGATAAHDSGAERWEVEADVVLESVGPATWEKSVQALRRGGRLAVCGSTSGRTVELHMPTLFFRQLEVIGSTMGSGEEFAEVTDAVADGLAVQVDAEYPLAAYPEALDRLEAGDQLGKLVLHHE